MDITTQIQTQATESANLLRFQGWEGGGHSYDIGSYPGDAEALAERIGRELTRDERVSLEYQIRRLLDAAIVAPVAFAAVGNDGRRPVVWGVGGTENEARADAAESLRDVGSYKDSEDLRIVAISAERRAKIEGGEVGAADL